MIVLPGNSKNCRRAGDFLHLCTTASGWPLTGDQECAAETERQVAELGDKQAR